MADVTAKKTIQIRLATTTYQYAHVPFEEAIDTDADWESWDWRPLNKPPDFFLMPFPGVRRTVEPSS